MGQDSWKQQAGGGCDGREEHCFIKFQCKVVVVTLIICARNGLFVFFTKNELLPAPLQRGRADLRVWLLVINPLTQRLVIMLKAAGH